MKKNKKIIIFGILFCLLISFTHIQCTNKVFTIVPQNKDIELNENIVASISSRELYIDIGSEAYGLDCDLRFEFEENPEEIIIKDISIEIPSKQLLIKKDINYNCNIGNYNFCYYSNTKDVILIDELLHFYNIKHKNSFTKTYIYWYLHKSNKMFVTYNIEYKINGKQYSSELKYSFTMKPETSSRVIDTMMSV